MSGTDKMCHSRTELKEKIRKAWSKLKNLTEALENIAFPR